MAALTIPEHNQEVTLYLQELTSTLPIQKLSWVHLTDNTSLNYQGFPRLLSICNFPSIIFYQLLCVAGQCVLHGIVIGIDTTHPQEVPLLEDNSLGQLEELLSI